MNKNIDEVMQHILAKKDNLLVLKNKNLAEQGADNEYYFICGQIEALNKLIDFYFNKPNSDEV